MSPLNPFKQCNIEIRVFVLAIFATNKEKKQGDNIFSWNYVIKLICIIDICHILKNTKIFSALKEDQKHKVFLYFYTSSMSLVDLNRKLEQARLDLRNICLRR